MSRKILVAVAIISLWCCGSLLAEGDPLQQLDAREIVSVRVTVYRVAEFQPLDPERALWEGKDTWSFLLKPEATGPLLGSLKTGRPAVAREDPNYLGEVAVICLLLRSNAREHITIRSWANARPLEFAYRGQIYVQPFEHRLLPDGEKGGKPCLATRQWLILNRVLP